MQANTMPILSESITNKISAANDRANALCGWSANYIKGYADDLLNRGCVEVGWKEACGATHRTMKVYREWVKIVKALRKEGFDITEERVTHKNSYATNNGGFWNSIIYRLNIAI